MNNIADKKKTEIINHHFDSLKMKEIFIKQDNKGDCSMFPFLFSKQPNLTKPNQQKPQNFNEKKKISNKFKEKKF